MDAIFNIDIDEKFKTVSEEIINNLYNKEYNTTIISNQITKTAKEEIKDIIIKNDFKIQDIHDLLLSKGYEENKINTFLTIVQTRREELLYSTLVHLNSAFGETITKFDWVLKLVYGTSELKKLEYPLLQLALTTVNDGDCRQKNYDVDKDILIKMINVLEGCDLH